LIGAAVESPPKLRALDARPLMRHGQPCVLLRDPLQLSDGNIVIPQQLVPALSLLDGTRDPGAVSAALAIRFGVPVASSTLDRLVTALDDALLLDNARFHEARERALADYRQADSRAPASAGASYPAEADELRGYLQSMLDGAGEVSPVAAARGMICPHIDYERGGAVYAQTWARMVDAVQAAEIVVLLGTDHYSEGHLLTLTRQRYATPLGVLPTAVDAVDSLAEAIGPEAAFAGELHHRGEHSIELAAVWLHHEREEQPCPIIPVLCGSFERFLRGDGQAEDDPTLTAFVTGCRKLIAGRTALVIAAADLAHVGPAFGGRPVGFVERAQLQAADHELIGHICAGDSRGFVQSIRRVGDRHSVCGLPPIYLMLRLLAPAEGESVAYLRCPADDAGTSLVSVCGVIVR
jgi:AmmeMemoRadiSam system protein B